MASAIPWKRILAEGIAIIASILIAFWIDAAWQARQERGELLRLLEGLHAELIQNREEAQQASTDIAEALDRLRFMTSASEDEFVAVPPPETYETIYLPLVRNWSAQFATGYLDAAIGSGQLSLISRSDTQAALSAFKASIKPLDSSLRQLDRLATDAAAIVGSDSGGRLMFGRDDRGLESETLRALHRDAGFAGVLGARLIWFGGYEATMNWYVVPALEQAIELIERDLAGVR